ncbi:MAG: double zinc ribbon domain-containing protein [Candidatus Saccharibacteria bacterium]
MGKDLYMTNCSACGYALEPGDKFCGNCGTAIMIPSDAAFSSSSAKAKRCPSCKQVSVTDSSFCTECGSRLEEITDSADGNDVTIILNLKQTEAPPLAEPTTPKNADTSTNITASESDTHTEISVDEAIRTIRASEPVPAPATPANRSTSSKAKTLKIAAACVIGGLFFLGSLFVTLNWARHLSDDVASKPAIKKSTNAEPAPHAGNPPAKSSTPATPVANTNTANKPTPKPVVAAPTAPTASKQVIPPVKTSTSKNKLGGSVATVQQIGYMKLEVSNAQANFVASSMNPTALAKAEARYRASVNKLGHALYTNYKYSGRGTAAAQQEMRTFMMSLWSGIPSPAVAQEINRGVAAVK